MGDTDEVKYHTSARRGSRSINLLGAEIPGANLDEYGFNYFDFKVNLLLYKICINYSCLIYI